MDYISFAICNMCNINCINCYRNKTGEFFQLQDLKHVFKLKDLGIKVINISGGEPYLIKGLHQIIEALSKNFYLYISSNGLLFNKEELLYINQNKKIRLLSLPLYGNKDYNDRIMLSGHFDKIIEIIKFYDNGQFDFSLKVNTVVTKQNFSSLYSFYRNYLAGKKIVWRLFELQYKGDFKKNASRLEYEQLHVKEEEIKLFVIKMNNLYNKENIFTGTINDLKKCIVLDPNLDVCESHIDYKKIMNLKDEDFVEKFISLQDENDLICGKY